MTSTQAATPATLADRIAHLAPCHPAEQWLSQYKAGEEEKAWAECRDGSWMIWLIGKGVRSAPWGEGRKTLLACALDCAETVRHLWPVRQRDGMAMAVAVLRDWVLGTAALEQAKQARKDLEDAAGGADYATYAADAAAYSAYAFDAAAAAYYAAYAAARAASDAAAAARDEILAECTAIVRSHYPHPPAVGE